MSAEFVTHLLDLLSSTRWAGRVHARRMFGGFGIYLDQRMAGLVADDTLFLKTDTDNRQQFVVRQLPPFTYRKKDGEYAMSYFQAPAEALDEGDELADWLDVAAGAAQRAAAKKAKPRRRARQRPSPKGAR